MSQDVPDERWNVFQPWAADMARAMLLVNRSGAGDLIEARLRPTSRGRPRKTSATALLVLAAYTLHVFKVAQTGQLNSAIDQLLSPAVLDALDLRQVADTRVTPYQIDYLFRAIARVYAHDPLRPVSAKLDDPVRAERRKAFQELITCLCSGWLPDDLPTGDVIVFDATGQPSAARPLAKSVREALLAESSLDLLTAAERKLPEQKRRQLQRSRSHRAVEGRYGHQTRTDEHPSDIFGGFAFYNVLLVKRDDSAPALLLTTTMTAASGTQAEALMVEQLDALRGRVGGDPVIVADREFSTSDSIWRLLRSRGQRFAFDLYARQRAPQGSWRGLIVAQGGGLCPATPSEFVDPGQRPIAEHRGERQPAYTRWLRRLEQQRPYRCHVRSVRPGGLNLSCPALKPARCQCALRQTDLDPSSALPIVINHPPASARPAICRNATVFLPDEHNAYRQTFPWGQKSWTQHFAYGRAGVEGEHGLLKHAAGRALNRWVTFSSSPTSLGIFVALDLAFVQLHLFRNWLDRHRDEPWARALLADPLYGSDAQAVSWLLNTL